MKKLTEKALLVDLTISQWSARKYDRKATKEVDETHNTKDAGRFNKILIATDHLKAIQSIVTEARQYHYDNTLPWDDKGRRLMPSTNYFDFTKKMSEIKSKFEKEVANFAASYPTMIEEARVRLNGLFNDDDYPNDIEEKFDIRVSFSPIPEKEDIRVDIDEAEVLKLQDAIGKEINNRFAEAHRNIFQRVVDHLKHMKERLDVKDSVFKNTLFENILPLIDLLPRLNVAGDPNVDTMCNDLRSLYVDPDNVRNSKRLRAQKAGEVDALLNKFNTFYNAA